ncbi:hypothetical protein SAMN04487969_102476 [Paenibacillus algorifonticola]|uniref:Uncharacterized protein n=1 Tax=Paenibacillus algorifonticola TaxID=684063 RepID=A0A1I2AG17_9BACL|nr:hypothetical protein [Paenibacillus algorifonticola]SFE42954.1 hypothetical protein SAMN04487969_102476 [Paenibacillus algorifonticola]
MHVADFESIMISRFIKSKKEWSGRGAIKTTFNLHTSTATLIYEAEFTSFEQYLLDLLGRANKFDFFLEDVTAVMKNDFDPVFESMYPGLKIEEMTSEVEGEHCRNQIVTIRFNKNLRQLVVNDQIDMRQVLA